MGTLNEQCKFIAKTIREFLNEDQSKNLAPFINEKSNDELTDFLNGKKFVSSKSKRFFYHGTQISPKDFVLRDDYEGEDGNTWNGDLPEGYLFLTTSLDEAKAYGRYIIPCELKNISSKSFKTNADNPSQIFDRDYGIDLYRNDKQYSFW